MGLTQKLGTIPLAIQTDSSNNVGIGGAANASYKLDVTGTIRATGSIFGDVGFRTKSLNGYLLKNDADSANLGGLVRRSYWAGGAALDTQIFAETGYGIFLNVNGSSTTGMSIASSGAATFTNIVTAGGRIQAQGSNGAGTSQGGFLINYNQNANSRSWLINNDYNVFGDFAILQTTTQTGSTFTAPFYISPSGNVGISTLSPAALFTIKGRGGADIIFQMNDESNIRRCFYIPNQYYGYMWAVGVVSNGGKAFSFGNQDGSEVGTIVINSSSVAYNTTSDYRLKEDLKDFDGLSILSKVKFYDFKWKSEDTRTTGVIAHELQEVVPYAVNGEKDAIGKDDNPSYQGVDYSKLIAIMGKAIQELNAKVTALENKL